MSKLSPALKATISAAIARPGTTPAPSNIRSVFQGIAQEAASKKVGMSGWLTISTAATMTMNSPESLLELHRVAAPKEDDTSRGVQAAELMREVGIKCISFNGIPRVINCLGEFRAGLPTDVVAGLSTKGTRKPTPENISSINTRGEGLWTSIYSPFDTKLLQKLADSHPNLPIHIVYSHYGPLLSDPAEPYTTVSGAKVGRVLTSLVGICCLRAQTGVAPQVTSHIFGLRKAFEDGSFEAKGEEEVKGGRWLASDEGSVWVLETVDRIVEAIGRGQGTTFAPGLRAKL